jgi:hypothetical protein
MLVELRYPLHYHRSSGDPTQHRADTNIEVADGALGNSQNERLPDVNYEWEDYLAFLYSQQ